MYLLKKMLFFVYNYVIVRDLKQIIFLTFTVFISFTSPSFSQPDGGVTCSGPNPPAWCTDCNWPNPPPQCKKAVPIDTNT